MDRDRLEIATEVRHALRVLVRQGWIVLACALIAAAVGYLLASREDEVYEARAQVLVQPYSPDLALPDTPAGFSDPTRARATALQLATIPQVSRRVAERLGSAFVPGAVSTTAAGDSDVITVRARAAQGRLAAKIANGYASEYIQFRRETNQRRYFQAAEIIEERVEKALVPAVGGTSAERAQINAERRRDRERLRRQMDRLRVLAATQTGGAQVVQWASDPGAPEPGDERRDALIGGLGGLILGLGLIFTRDRLRDRIENEDDIPAIAPGVPVVGYVPAGRSRRSTPRVAEGFHNLAASLMGLRPDGGPRTLLVTSATGKDGKSSVAINLALDLAQRGLDPLYVEADLRRPSLADVAEIEGPDDGTRAVLAGTRTVSEALATATLSPAAGRSGAPRIALAGELAVLPAGTGNHLPQTILSDRSVSSLLARARERAGYVIVDGPPLGLVADVLPVAKRVEAVLVVVRLGHTRAGRLRRLLELLANAQVTPAGVVVIGAEAGEYYR